MSVIMYFKGVKNICISEYFKGSNVPEVYFKGGHYKYEETPPEGNYLLLDMNATFVAQTKTGKTIVEV